MKRSLPVFALAAVCAAAAAAAYEPVTAKPLSAACCKFFLTELLYFNSPTNTGVPAYTMAMDEEAFALSHGSSFSVTDGAGNSEAIVFQAADFADVGAATPQEVADAVNGQLTLGHAFLDDGMLMLRGNVGGTDGMLELQDGNGEPLAELGFPIDTMMGAEDVELRLETALDGALGGAGFPGHPYLLVMSTTEGSQQVAGHTLPLAIDATTMLGLRAVELGLLPGFLGQLGSDGGTLAAYDTALLPKMFPAGTPERIYFAFVVFEPDLSGIELISNRFQAVIED